MAASPRAVHFKRILFRYLDHLPIYLEAENDPNIAKTQLINSTQMPQNRVKTTHRKLEPCHPSRTPFIPEFQLFPIITGDTCLCGSESELGAAAACLTARSWHARTVFCPERRLAPALVPDARQDRQLPAYLATVWPCFSDVSGSFQRPRFTAVLEKSGPLTSHLGRDIGATLPAISLHFYPRYRYSSTRDISRNSIRNSTRIIARWTAEVRNSCPHNAINLTGSCGVTMRENAWRVQIVAMHPRENRGDISSE